MEKKTVPFPHITKKPYYLGNMAFNVLEKHTSLANIQKHIEKLESNKNKEKLGILAWKQHKK